jgi:hypothetical protein
MLDAELDWEEKLRSIYDIDIVKCLCQVHQPNWMLYSGTPYTDSVKAVVPCKISCISQPYR